MHQLPPEKEFAIASFNHQCDRMSREQAIKLLKATHQLLMLKDEAYKSLIKQQLMEEFDPMPQDLQSEVRVVIESERLVRQQELDEAVKSAIARHEETGIKIGFWLSGIGLFSMWFLICLYHQVAGI